MGRPKGDVEISRSRTIAKKSGVKFYRGRPCPTGHRPAVRYTSTGCCVKCVADVIAADSTKGLREYESVQMERELDSQIKEVWDE